MGDFERQLVGQIPLVEASTFFIGVKHHGWPMSHDETFVKVAAVKKSQAQQVMDDLLAGRMPEGKAGKFKLAAEKKNGDTLEDRLVRFHKERGTPGFSSVSEYKKMTEPGTYLSPYPGNKLLRRIGQGLAAGTAGFGALMGGAYGRALKPGKYKLLTMPAGALVGAGAFTGAGMAGRKAGTMAGEPFRQRMIKALERYEKKSEAGDYITEADLKQVEQDVKERDARQKEKDSCGAGTMGTASGAVKSAAARLKAAAVKFAQDMVPAQQEIVPNQSVPEPTPATPSQTVPPTPAAPPFQSQQQPVNYMGAEMLGQQAQQSNESQFYRERLGKAVAENQQLQQQAQQLQQAVDQLQQQTAASGEQIQAATQQAVEAGDRALQHSQEAANMRMAIQQMRERLLQVASEEPAAITQQNQAQAEAAANQQMAMAGTPEAAPAPGGGAPAGSAPAGAGGQQASPAAASGTKSEASPSSSGESGQSEQKTAASWKERLGYGALGAGIGAVGGVLATNRIQKAEERVRQLEEQGQEGFTAAVELAKAKAELASAYRDRSQPVRTTLREVGKGALGGAVIAPALVGQLSRLQTNMGM